MGKGADVLAHDRLLTDGLQSPHRRLSRDDVEPVEESAAEIARVMELIRRLQHHVSRAVADGAFPLVLAGNCNSSLGTTAGIGAEDLGVIWFDAHADFDDPDENVSGFFDVMALAMLTGRGWAGLRATIPGHRPIPARNVILAGVRDLEPYQRERLRRSDLLVVPDRIDPTDFARAATDLSERVTRVYVHLDLDVIDADEARANQYAATGGPSVEHVSECLRLIHRTFRVAAGAITAYDPSYDPGGRALRAARGLAPELVGVPTAGSAANY